MIYPNKHSASVYQSCQLHQITTQDPLIVLKDQSLKHSFLNLTVEYFFRIKHNIIPHSIKKINTKDIRLQLEMELPMIGYLNVNCEGQKLLQFICDVFLCDRPYHQYIQRKISILQTYKFWKAIFKFQKNNILDFSLLKHLGIFQEKDYENIIVQYLQILGAQLIGKTYFRKYQTYSEKGYLEIEQVFFADIILSILNVIPQSFPDLTLRGYFSHLIDYSFKIQGEVKQVKLKRIASNTTFQVCFLQPINLPQKKQYKLLNFNPLRFFGIFGIAAILYKHYLK